MNLIGITQTRPPIGFLTLNEALGHLTVGGSYKVCLMLIVLTWDDFHDNRTQNIQYGSYTVRAIILFYSRSVRIMELLC